MSVVKTEAVSLADVQPGTTCVVTAVAGDDSVAQRLIDLGLVKGTRVQVVRRAPLGDPIAFRFRDTTMCLRRAQARRVQVA